MNNLLRAREITWFLVGLTSMMLAFYTYYNGSDTKQTLYFVVLSIASAGIFYLRRSQRKKLESEK